MTNAALIDDARKTFFEVFGYLHFPGLFREAMPALTAAFEHLFEEYAADVIPWTHVVHADLPRFIMPGPVERSDYLAALTADPQVAGIVRGLIGDGYQLIGSDANIYECGSRWHTDITGLPYNCRNVKIIFYLDAMTAGQDAFRVIPGSHHHTDRYAKQLKRHVKTPRDTLGVEIPDVPSVEINVTPGDIVVFDARIWHCVPHAGNRRRMVSFLYADEDYTPQAPAAEGDYR